MSELGVFTPLPTHQIIARAFTVIGEEYGYTEAELVARNRSWAITPARRALVGGLRRAGITFEEIGRVMHRDHATALHHWQRHEEEHPESEEVSIAKSIAATFPLTDTRPSVVLATVETDLLFGILYRPLVPKLARVERLHVVCYVLRHVLGREWSGPTRIPWQSRWGGGTPPPHPLVGWARLTARPDLRLLIQDALRGVGLTPYAELVERQCMSAWLPWRS